MAAVSFSAVQAAQPPTQAQQTRLVLGLSGRQVAIAAGVGLGAGAAAAFFSRYSIRALLSRSALAGLGVGTLVGLYVAHLAVEAVLVGGVYYYWPNKRAAEDDPSRSMKLRIDQPAGHAAIDGGAR
jgi:hypothetical protein